MNRESLDTFCERGILALVLAILVFTPLAFGGVPQIPVGSRLDFLLVNSFNIVQWLTVGVITLWTVRLWAAPRPKLLWPPVSWAVVAFALYAVVRYLTADIEYVARAEMIQVLMYAFLFLAIINNLHRQESAQVITLTLIFLAMAISFYAVYQFASGSDKVWGCLIKPYPKRGSGTFISPNNVSAFFEMILPLALAYTLTSRLKALSKVFTGYAFLAILVGIIATVSRGSWFATALALVVFFTILMFHHAHRVPALAFLAAVVIAGFYLAPRDVFIKTRLHELQDPNGGISDDGRYGIWRAAVHLWRENVWWGIGPGEFDYRFGKYRPELVQASPDRVHNDYLNTLTDWGVVGVALVAAAWALAYASAIRTWKSVRHSATTLGDHRSNKLTLVLGASIGLLAILFHSVVDFNMHIPANALVAVTLLALLSSYIRFATESYWFTARLPIKSILTVALVAGVVYIGSQAAVSARQSVWLMRAQKSKPQSPEQLAALKNAFAADPRNADTARSIGEWYRLQSWQNGGDYEQQANEAMTWFKRATQLNPYDDSSTLRYGLCLDQIGRHEEAFTYIDRANQMDPNSAFNNAYMGWHYIQINDNAGAIPWLQRSHRLQWWDNPIASSYLQIARNQMLQAATNTSQFELRSSTNQFMPPAWDKN